MSIANLSQGQLPPSCDVCGEIATRWRYVGGGLSQFVCDEHQDVSGIWVEIHIDSWHLQVLRNLTRSVGRSRGGSEGQEGGSGT
jgi:hypothetical protein